jgi:hypothetical protein
MHQLSKDPDCTPRAGNTPYNRESMLQYLHYCTETLAILSKIGQLYVEDFHDGTTLAAVDQFENLATGLSQKIWQKIMILSELIAEHPQPERPAPGTTGA